MPESTEQLNVKKPQEDIEKKPGDLGMKPEDESETLEDFKKLVQEKIENAEKELGELIEPEKRIADCNNNVNLPTDKVEEIKITAGVIEKLESVNEKGRSLKKLFEEKLRILLASLMITLGSVDVGIARANNGPEIKSEPKIEEIIKNEDKEKENAELYGKKIAEFGESARNDSHERIVIASKNDGNLEFAESIGKKNFVYIDFEKIETAIKNGSEKIEIIHTHPLAMYSDLLRIRIKEMKNEKVELSPMPPSKTDMIGLMQTLNYFKANNSRIENKIIDSTGEWIFKIGDEDNYFIKKYSALLEKYSNPETYNAALNETEKNEINSRASLTANTHPENRIINLPSELRNKLIKMETDDIRRDFPDKEWFDLFGEDKFAYIKNFAEASNLVLEISKYDEKRTKKERAMLIKKYIEKCKKIGIDVSYKPFRDKER